MTLATPPTSSAGTVADLLQRLGGISPERILLRPPVGTATEQDVVDTHRRTRRLCELVEGTLVEKGVGYRESILALAIASALRAFVLPRNLGLVSGESGMMRLWPGLVRIPDVAFVSWSRIPGGKMPADPVPQLAPDLAVEVLSESNTPAEMQRKRGEYFSAGVRLVWEVDPAARTVAIYTNVNEPTVLSSGETLSGEDVLPGFELRLSELFGELDRQMGVL